MVKMMKTFITLLLAAIIVISTNTFASDGKTATNSTVKMTDHKIGVMSVDALNVASIELPDKPTILSDGGTTLVAMSELNTLNTLFVGSDSSPNKVKI
jgi:hypothetical protein